MLDHTGSTVTRRYLRYLDAGSVAAPDRVTGAMHGQADAENQNRLQRHRPRSD